MAKIKRAQADRIVREHVLWAIGAGFIPIPMADFATVTGIQVDMLNKLSGLYDVEYAASTGKSLVAALTGTTFARLGASMVKAIPGVGSVIGGVSMSIMSGASTYAVAQVAIENFAAGRDLFDIDLKAARNAYRGAYEDGKEYAVKLNDEKGTARDVFEKLEKLGKLRDEGLITEEEFQEQKERLLERL